MWGDLPGNKDLAARNTHSIANGVAEELKHR
jgi:hypothetical protein